jgi:hypothetical protein
MICVMKAAFKWGAVEWGDETEPNVGRVSVGDHDGQARRTMKGHNVAANGHAWSYSTRQPQFIRLPSAAECRLHLGRAVDDDVRYAASSGSGSLAELTKQAQW